MHNTCNTPAMPLNNAHPGGFFLFIKRFKYEIYQTPYNILRKGISSSKIFCIFLIFKKLIIIPGEWENFKNNLLQLLEEHNDIDIKRMGFPDDWGNRINSI